MFLLIHTFIIRIINSYNKGIVCIIILYDTFTIGSQGGATGTRAPSQPKCVHFHAVSGKIDQNNILMTHLWGYAPPPTPYGNPGPVTASHMKYFIQQGRSVCEFLAYE